MEIIKGKMKEAKKRRDGVSKDSLVKNGTIDIHGIKIIQMKNTHAYTLQSK